MCIFALGSGATLLMIQKQIIHLSKQHNRLIPTYQEAVQLTFGQKPELYLCLLILAKLYGTGLAYFIVVGDSLEPIVKGFLSENEAPPWYLERQLLISYFVVLVALPLCLLRTMSSLAYFSFLGVVSILYTALLVSTESVLDVSADTASQASPLSSGWDLLKPVGVVVLAFGCHLQSPQVFAEIERMPRRKRTHMAQAQARQQYVVADTALDTSKPIPDDDVEEQAAFMSSESSNLICTDQRTTPQAVWDHKLHVMTLAIAATLIFSFILQGTTGLLASLSAADRQLPGNILNMYSVRRAAVTTARVAIAIAVTLTYPLVHSTARHALYGLVCKARGEKSYLPMPLPYHAGLAIVYVLVTWGLAMVLTDVGVVLAIIGSSAGIITNYFIPSLFALVSGTSWADPRTRGVAWVIAVCSLPLAVLGVVTAVL